MPPSDTMPLCVIHRDIRVMIADDMDHARYTF